MKEATNQQETTVEEIARLANENEKAIDDLEQNSRRNCLILHGCRDIPKKESTYAEINLCSELYKTIIYFFNVSSAPLKSLMRIAVNLKRTLRSWLAELQLDFICIIWCVLDWGPVPFL